MREIKFRGKSKKDGKWLYGDLLRNVDGDFAVVQPFGIHMNNYCGPYEVNPDTIGQFTGLKDRDETEIYEGDLLLSAGMVWEVVYNENLASFVLCTEYCRGSTPLGEMIRSFDFKISGNIFDNKDLLEETK